MGSSSIFGANNIAQLLRNEMVTQDGQLISSSGTRNYIRNNMFTRNVNGWITYADAAATTPVDGTGGTANITFTRSTTTPLRGPAQGLFTKDAANRQGQGVAYAFSIDRADRSKPLGIQFDFEVLSGTYASGDLTVYIYDVTNSVLITPSSINLAAGTGTFNASFVSTSSTSYRLILHVASTSAVAYTVGVDNFSVGPFRTLSGFAGSDWFASTAPAGNWYVTGPTNVTTNVQESRIGDSVEFDYSIKTTGTSAAFSEIELKLPYTIDTTKLPARGSTGETFIGTGEIYRAGSARRTVTAFIANGAAGTSITIRLENDAAADPTAITDSSPVAWNATGNIAQLHLRTIRLPVVGWSSNVTMADRAVEEYSSDDGTADVFGPNGSPVPNQTIGTAVSRDFTFQSTRQATDLFVLEVFDGQGWTPAYTRAPFMEQGTNKYGMQGLWVSATVYRVTFGAGGLVSNGATYGANGADSWASLFSTWRFRVRKVSGGASVGFPVNARNIVGDVSGTAVPAGMIGEVVNFTARSIVAVAANYTASALVCTLPSAGTWLIFGVAGFDGAINSRSFRMAIATNNANDATGLLGEPLIFPYAQTAGAVSGTLPMPVIYYQATGSTILYAKGQIENVGQTLTVSGRAVRIA